MVKTSKIKVKSVENDKIIMAKTIITKIIVTIMIRMRIEIGNPIKI